MHILFNITFVILYLALGVVFFCLFEIWKLHNRREGDREDDDSDFGFMLIAWPVALLVFIIARVEVFIEKLGRYLAWKMRFEYLRRIARGRHE